MTPQMVRVNVSAKKTGEFRKGGSEKNYGTSMHGSM